MTLRKRVLRWVRRGLIAGFGVLLVAAGFGWSWERSEHSAFLEAAYSPPGEMMSVGGQDLHVVVEGTGSPGVLLISGLGDHHGTWRDVQRRLADSVRVVSYDRPGLGWSPPRETALTVDAAVQDIRGLLASPGLFDGAPILVGHSLGGLIARQFAHEYPSQVSGLVLLDSPPPQGLPTLMNLVVSMILRWNAWSGTVGSRRWRYYRDNPQLTREQELRRGHLNVGGSRSRETLRELKGVSESDPVELPRHGLGTLPLTLFVAVPVAPPGFESAVEELDAAKRLMAQESERGRLVDVTTGHYIHSENPDTVIAEVFRMLGALRSEAEVGEGMPG